MNSKSVNTSQRLVNAAAELFLRDGINSTGIAAVAEHAGVSKMTLYAHFASKDELIVAYLDQRNEAWNLAVDARLASIAQPAEQLLGLFDLYREWLLKGNSRGCAYVNCAAEFPEREHPVRLAVSRHKQSIRDHLSFLASAACLDNPELIARRLFVMLEGAFVTGALENDDGIFDVARQMAGELIQSATR